MGYKIETPPLTLMMGALPVQIYGNEFFIDEFGVPKDGPIVIEDYVIVAMKMGT